MSGIIIVLAIMLIILALQLHYLLKYNRNIKRIKKEIIIFLMFWVVATAYSSVLVSDLEPPNVAEVLIFITESLELEKLLEF